MTYLAGVGRRDITPPAEWIDAGRIWLWGFGDRTAPCSAVLDPLDVRALAVRDDGGATAILVSVDVGALDPASTDRIRQRVAAEHGIAGEYVCVNVSHTHNAPVFVSIPTWQPGVALADAGFVQLVEDAVVGAVADALADLRPVRLEFGRSTTDIAHDRHPTGAAMDRTLDVVQATGVDGTPIAVVFVAACHPVARGSAVNLVSSDFIGPARSGIEAQAGGTAIFLQGYAGTCNPAVAPTEALGAALAGDVLSVLSGPMDALAGPVDAWLDSVELPLQPIRPGAVAAAAIDPDPLYQRWASWMQQQGAAVPATLPTPVQAIRIGTGRDAWYLSASGHEVVMDLAATVRGLWPYERVTVAAYSNSQLSYVPSRAVLQSPVCTTFPSCAGSFNYEGGQSFTWYGHRGPLTLDAEALFVDAHIAVLDHGWEHIGHAVDVVGLASWGERLFAVTSNHVLWWRSPVAEDVPWHAMGHATSVCGLTACDGALYCATTDGKLWTRSIHGHDRPWRHIGHATSVVAMTALDGRLFAATANHKLWRRDPVDADIPWEDMGHAQLVAGLAATRGKLFAATTDGNLHWRHPYGGDLAWHRYGHAQEVVGMTAIGDRLFVATQQGKLWQRPV